MEKLVGMGFGNRELNRELLSKHGNELQVLEREREEREGVKEERKKVGGGGR